MKLQFPLVVNLRIDETRSVNSKKRRHSTTFAIKMSPKNNHFFYLLQSDILLDQLIYN